MGGSIQYTNLGQNGAGNFIFNVKVYVYRYCEPGSAVLDKKLWVGAYSSDPNNLNLDTLTFQKKIPLVSLKTIVPPNLSDTCANLLSVCVEEGIYEFNFVLPPTSVGYTLIADVCCRNPNIVNLVTPSQQGIAFFATIPPTSITNNSPLYAIPPVPFLCTSDTNIVSNTVYDLDGDSLSYTFAWPFAGLGPFGAVNGLPFQYPAPIPKVVYSPGFGQFNPFGNAGVAEIDSLNGLSTFYNPNTGFFVVSIFIREYRNGIQIAQYRRDLQLIFIPCPANEPPQLTSAQQFNYSINEGDSLCIPISFVDVEGDSIFITHSGLIFDSLLFNPPAILNDNNGLGTDSTEFCWVTTCETGGPNVYSFTVQASDNGCPPKSNFFVYNIDVIPVITNAQIIGPDTICDPTAGPFMFYVINGDSTPLNNHWQVTNGTIVSNPLSDTILVNNVSNPLTVSFSEYGTNGCESDAQVHPVIIGTNPQINVTASDTAICAGDNTVLTASGTVDYSWYDNNSGIPFATGTTVTVSPSVTTTYTVVGVDSVGCIDIETITIAVYPAATLLNIGGITSACPNLLGVVYYVINGNATSTYTWTVNGGVIASGQGSDTIVVDWGGIGNGTVTVSELTQDVCPSQPVTITVSITQNIIVPTGPPQIICIGNTAQIGNAPVGGYTYLWTPAFGLSGTTISDPIVTISTLGTYTYTLTVNDGNGCSNTDSVTVTIVPLPIVSISPSTTDTICAGDTLLLTGNGASTYTWYDITNPGISIGTGNPFAVNPTVTITYYTIGNDVNGCPDNDTITVFVHDPPPSVPNIVGNTVTCANTTGLLYYVSNSNPNSTYTWVISGGNIVSGQGTDSIIVDWTINGTGTLTVVEITEDGCPSQPSVLTIVVSPQIYVPIGPAQTICEGQTTTLGDFPQAGFTYAWTPSTGLSSTTISNPSLTLNNVGVYTYYLFVIDANGCSNIDSVQVTVLLAPAIVTSSNPSTIICPYDSVILSATGAFTYQWYQIGNAALIGSGSSITVYPTTTTSYYVIGNDGGICEGLDTITVQVYPLSTLNIIGGDDTPCADTLGTVYYIPNSNSTSTYTWIVTGGSIVTGQGTDTITTLWLGNSGTITVIETDTNGCESLPATLNVQIAPPVQASTSSGQTIVCENDSVQIYTCPAVAGGVYSWNVVGGSITSGQGTNTITVNWQGPAPATGYIYYSITATTDTLCYTPSDSLIINLIASPIVTASYTSPPPCVGDTAWYAVNTTFGSIYNWTTTGGTIVYGANTDSIGVVFTSNGTYTITLIVDTGVCPSLPFSFTVNVGTAIAAISGNNAICDGQSTQLTATGTGTIFAWSPSTGLSSTSVFDPTATPTTTTTYTVVVSNGNSCTASASITITVGALPNVIATTSSSNICFGGSAQLNASGGTIYSWSPAAGLSNTAIANPVATPATTTTYTVAVSDGTCTATASVTINVSLLNVSASATNPNICEGQSTGLISSGGLNFSWIPATGLSNTAISNPNASPTTTTTYTVTIDDGAGCSATATVIVNVFAAPVVTATNDSVICNGTSVQLSANGGLTYSWTPPNGLTNTAIANPVATPTATTSYTVTVTDANGCTATDEVVLSIDNFVDASFTLDDSIRCTGIEIKFTNTSTDALQYEWIFGDGGTSTEENPIHFFALGQNYNITLVAINGNCTDTFNLVYNTPILDTIFKNIPNIITPNGDGKNDCFEIGGIVSYRECLTMKVFDRWGVSMYESGGKKTCWDGTNRDGKPVPTGVYYYILKLSNVEYNGFVHVIRE